MAKLSPRLIWLKKHNLALGELPDGSRFLASAERIVRAETHRDCEERWAASENIPHWSAEDFKRATEPVIECE